MEYYSFHIIWLKLNKYKLKVLTNEVRIFFFKGSSSFSSSSLCRNEASFSCSLWISICNWSTCAYKDMLNSQTEKDQKWAMFTIMKNTRGQQLVQSWQVTITSNAINNEDTGATCIQCQGISIFLYWTETFFQPIGH